MSRRGGVILGVGVMALFFILGAAVNTTVEALWFEELGFGSVYWTAFRTRLVVRLIAGLVILGFFFANLRVASRSFSSIRRRISNIEFHEEIPARYLNLTALAGATFLAFLFSAAVSSRWLDILAWIHQAPFDTVDPVFGKNIAFYVFSLPLYRHLQSLALLLVIAAIVILGVVYVTSGGLEFVNNRLRFRERPLRHLGVNVALLLLILAWGYRLDLYELVYSTRGVVYGASYTDIHAQMLGFQVLLALALAGFGLVVYDLVRGRFKLTLTALGALVIGIVLFKGLYPNAIQQFEVEPNEIGKEAPYIARNIAHTRAAYDLNAIVERPFAAAEIPAVADLEAAGQTLANIRLWDWRPLLDSYSQLQEIRLYYEFEDVDVDRYDLGAGPQQVMLAAREMAVEELAPDVQTWQNLHLIFTHGYGLVMSPVNAVTPEGLPQFFLSDIPPSAPDSLAAVLTVDRPEIYYGERTADYVLAATRAQEFDFPQGDQNIYTSYQGTGGLPVDAWWRRAVFGWYLGSLKFLLTDEIMPESRLLLFRQIRLRAARIAPFLEYDADPYLVLLGGRLLWVQDAYLTSDRYPYSEPVTAFGGRRLNYIRNSVKVVIDAYDGDVSFYAWDPADPLLRTYANVFPELFTPRDAMPEGLEAHMRFPEDLFTIQADVLRAYHMQDPRVFYNREDLWNFPNEVHQGTSTPMEPYYVLLRLPDDETLAFQLVQPFTPARRDNMIALLAAKSDPADYGRRVVYQFPKDRLIYGPMQIEARIDQDPVISQQITLWSQKGSSVIRGSLLVIPIGEAILYVEPLFLQAQQSQLPELTRVIVTYGSNIVMEPTLEDAMAALIRESGGGAFAGVGGTPDAASGMVTTAPGAGPAVGPPGGSPPTGPAAPAEAPALARQAQAAYQRAVAAQRRGDWAAYGAALEDLGRILEQLAGST
ncbi:MAG: UPF0182 family protein [Gemmatimonadota bacterium]